MCACKCEIAALATVFSQIKPDCLTKTRAHFMKTNYVEILDIFKQGYQGDLRDRVTLELKARHTLGHQGVSNEIEWLLLGSGRL